MYPSNIDFVCISLNESIERREQASQMFESIGIRPIWWIVDRHPVDGICGCFESHYSIWTSPELTKEFTLIFEDDIQLAKDFDLQHFKDVLNRLKYILPEEGDILKFDRGLMHIKDRRILDFPQSKCRIQMSRGEYFGTLAYAIHRPSFTHMARKLRPYLGINVDIAMFLEARCLSLEPTLFYQDYTTSYISNNSTRNWLINILNMDSLYLLVNRNPLVHHMSRIYSINEGTPRNVECIDRRISKKKNKFI